MIIGLKIENNKVVDRSKFENEETLFDGWIKDEWNAQIGWTLENDEYIPPVQPPVVISPRDQRRDQARKGFEFQGKTISATGKDQAGLHAIKDHLSLLPGMQTNFEFENGTVLPIDQDTMDDLFPVWVAFRHGLFNP